MADTTFEIDLPDEFVALLGARPQASATAREYIVLGLFQEDRISGGKAAELLGLTRLGFVALLARKGISYFRLTSDEWAKEVATVSKWGARRVSCYFQHRPNLSFRAHKPTRPSAPALHRNHPTARSPS